MTIIEQGSASVTVGSTRGRMRILAAAVAAVVFGVGWFVAINPSASGVESSRQITVGPNVRVSTEESRLHAEATLAADPNDPSRLAACSAIEARPGGGILGGFPGHTVLYVSHDSGRTWTKAVEDSSTRLTADGRRRKASSWDPTCEYGPAGELYFGTGARLETGELGVRLHRSEDAGRVWLRPTEIQSGYIDKPWIAVDTRPGSPYLGRVYIAYLGRDSARGRAAGGRADLLIASTDGGGSFTAPVADTTFTLNGANDGVVLSNGTLIMLTGHGSPAVLVSTDGGGRRVAARVWSSDAASPSPTPRTRGVSSGGTTPRIAADLSDGPFRDRIYVAWSALWNGRQQVLVAYSTDQGETWTPPRVVNDDVERPGEEPGADHVAPTIAVNRDGVVGVSWYDRREHPYNLGYDVRFSASLDGGETWLPSVRVSERPHLNANEDPMRSEVPIAFFARSSRAGEALSISISRENWIESGHFAGLAATADGVFHALWVDNRTGTSQLWTAPITVPGRAAPESTLEGLTQITEQVEIALDSVLYQRTSATTATITGEVTVTNSSSGTIHSPLRLELLGGRANSDGVAARVSLDPADADLNTARVWDLSAGLEDEALEPGETSDPVPIRLRLEDLALAESPAGQASYIPRGPELRLQVRIHGRPGERP